MTGDPVASGPGEDANGPQDGASVSPLLGVDDVVKHFPIRRGVLQRTVGAVRAVDGVNFEVATGETVGIVGESGSGKSTLARVILGLQPPTRGAVRFDGTDITRLGRAELRRLRPRMQMVFQDPYASLNPRMTVGRMISEAMEVHDLGDREWRGARTGELLEMVGLTASAAGRYPHEFSGGQRQRIGIARALATSPSLVVADEALSALDVSVQAQIVNLLLELRDELELTFLFISHDLSMVRFLCDRVIVLYLGRIVEQGPVDAVYHAPTHPYTTALLAAAPETSAERRRDATVQGEVPDPSQPPTGCHFHPRCPIATDVCRHTEPALTALSDGRAVACHHSDQLAASSPATPVAIDSARAGSAHPTHRSNPSS